jgi:propanol-preferring alcohol dehydrogenase
VDFGIDRIDIIQIRRFGIQKGGSKMPAPAMMKAALLTAYNAPIEIREVPRPVPKSNEVLVKIEASGVCFTDVHIWKGEHAAPNPLPLIMGHEGVGRVVEVGSPGGRLRVGGRVGIGYVHSACGHCRECQSGGENYCADFYATGYSTPGCFAEYVVLRQDWANVIPEGIEPTDAAPLMCAGAAAYASFLKTGVRAGETVAIFGLGGLGQYCVQIAKLAGARVIAVDLSPHKLTTAKGLGADVGVIADADAGRRIKELGGADGCVNFAPVAATWPMMLQACNPRSRIVMTGVPAQELAFYAHEVIAPGLTVIGSSASNRQEMRELLKLAAAGQIKGVIDRRPFSQINEAIADLIAGRVEGRIVLDLS